jgi:hypothetical protein
MTGSAPALIPSGPRPRKTDHTTILKGVPLLAFALSTAPKQQKIPTMGELQSDFDKFNNEVPF